MQEDYSVTKTEFNILSERLAAQTEAYVGFSNALVGIIQKLAEISADIDKLDSNNQDGVKDMTEKVLAINQLLQLYINNRRELDRNLAEEIAAYNMLVQQLTRDVQLNKASAETGVQSLLDKIEQHNNSMLATHQATIKTIQTSLSHAQREIESSTKALIAKYEESQGDKLSTISSYLSSRAKRETALERAVGRTGMFFLAMGTVVAIILALIQAGILQLTWGPK